MGTHFFRLSLCIMAVLVAMGCGNGMMPDPDGSNNPDGNVTLDSGNPPPDSVSPTDVQMPPADVQMTNDTGGGNVCHPTESNLTCAGATSCACTIPDMFSMPDECRTDATRMTACQSVMTCSPGQNRCSVHLPPNVFAANFACQHNVKYGVWDAGRGLTTSALTLRPDNNGIDALEWARDNVGSAYAVGSCVDHACYMYVGLASMMPRMIPFSILRFNAACTEMQVFNYQASADPLSPPMISPVKTLLYLRDR